jgi:hypothetical protein
MVWLHDNAALWLSVAAAASWGKNRVHEGASHEMIEQTALRLHG